MIELTEQQRQELSAPEPIAIDPKTRETYILVRRETYDRFKALLALDDYDPDDGAGTINEIMAEDDAKDPYLESYQHYGEAGMKRGDVVIVPFPFQDKPGQKIRPAVIVQSDAESRRLANTILAMVTGNLDDAGQPTTVLVDPNTLDGAGSGLSGPSLVKCYNLATMRQRRVLQVIGHLSDVLMQLVNHALKAALELP